MHRRIGDASRTIMGRISIKGVVVGGVTDIVSSTFIGILLTILVFLAFQILHVPHHDLVSYPPLHFAEIVSGLACSALGGYVAARIARRSEILNGSLSSFLCVGLGAWLILAGVDRQAVWEQALLLLLSPAMGAFGGHLRLRGIRAYP